MSDERLENVQADAKKTHSVPVVYANGIPLHVKIPPREEQHVTGRTACLRHCFPVLTGCGLFYRPQHRARPPVGLQRVVDVHTLVAAERSSSSSNKQQQTDG
jgi:hypothetical protein